MVKNPPAMQEITCKTGDPDLIPDQEDPMGKEMATHSSVLARKIPQTEEPGGLRSMGWQESDMTERLNYHQSIKIWNQSVVHLKLM